MPGIDQSSRRAVASRGIPSAMRGRLSAGKASKASERLEA
jgi:hypothetical protein